MNDKIFGNNFNNFNQYLWSTYFFDPGPPYRLKDTITCIALILVPKSGGHFHYEGSVQSGYTSQGTVDFYISQEPAYKGYYMVYEILDLRS